MHLFHPASHECIVTLGFGPYPKDLIRRFNMRFHFGIDFAPPSNIATKSFFVRAAADGNVLHTGFNTQAGNFVILSHVTPQNLMLSFYFHLEKILTHRGCSVLQNDIIGLMGSTGYSTGKHLHFGLAKLHLSKLEFINPAPYFT